MLKVNEIFDHPHKSDKMIEDLLKSKFKKYIGDYDVVHARFIRQDGPDALYIAILHNKENDEYYVWTFYARFDYLTCDVTLDVYKDDDIYDKNDAIIEWNYD